MTKRHRNGQYRREKGGHLCNVCRSVKVLETCVKCKQRLEQLRVEEGLQSAPQFATESQAESQASAWVQASLF